jgi:hypothetical protein
MVAGQVQLPDSEHQGFPPVMMMPVPSHSTLTGSDTVSIITHCKPVSAPIDGGMVPLRWLLPSIKSLHGR